MQLSGKVAEQMRSCRAKLLTLCRGYKAVVFPISCRFAFQGLGFGWSRGGQLPAAGGE